MLIFVYEEGDHEDSVIHMILAESRERADELFEETGGDIEDASVVEYDGAKEGAYVLKS